MGGQAQTPDQGEFPLPPTTRIGEIKLAHLKGSQTEKNILTAFAGESQARNRYTFFSKKAKKDGLVQIAQIFEETAPQEKAYPQAYFALQGENW